MIQKIPAQQKLSMSCFRRLLGGDCLPRQWQTMAGAPWKLKAQAKKSIFACAAFKQTICFTHDSFSIHTPTEGMTADGLAKKSRL